MQPSFDGVNVPLRGAALARRSEECTRYILIDVIRSEMPRASDRIIVSMKRKGVDAKTKSDNLDYGRGVSYVQESSRCDGADTVDRRCSRISVTRGRISPSMVVAKVTKGNL